jgi:hypothetical protein
MGLIIGIWPTHRIFRHFPVTVLQLLLSICNNILPSVYYPSNALRRATHLTYINFCMLRHRGAIIRKLLQQRCTSQPANTYVNTYPTRCNYTQIICKLLYMFRVVSPPIIRGTNNSSTIATCSNNGWLVPDAVDTVICTRDGGWRNHPKHVEQFTDKINCV